MVLDARAARGRGWACFWAAVDEKAARQVGEELASVRRRDAMNLLWVLAREIVRYPTGIAADEAGSCPVPSPAFVVLEFRPRGHAPIFAILLNTLRIRGIDLGREEAEASGPIAELEFHIPNMVCEGCASKISGALTAGYCQMSLTRIFRRRASP